METLQGLKVCPTYDCVLKCAGVDCFGGMLGAFGGEGCQGDTMKFASSDWGSPSSLSLPYLSKLDGCREKIDLNLSDVFTETDCMLPPGTCLPDSFADRETEFGVKGDMDILFSRVQRVCEHETTPAEIASIPEEERFVCNQLHIIHDVGSNGGFQFALSNLQHAQRDCDVGFGGFYFPPAPSSTLEPK
eukprot:766717-Hanusia_phi.AAC.3